MIKGQKLGNNQLEVIEAKWLDDHLDKRAKRVWAATEARSLGRGGISRVSEATGLARSTIQTGLREINSPQTVAPMNQIRRSGAGRKKNKLPLS
ncbi:hypothetical protein FACS1894200_11390 [Spirochaetia bacterium]|nr:hypothetical protein FACS1894200_11390 [Spirochaetia bacterium]